MNPPPRTSDTSLEYPALLLRLQAQALSRIAKGFSGVLDKVDDVLFDFLQKSVGTEQQHYADAMRDVRRSRSRVEGDLVSHLEAAFNALHQSDPLDAESALVDEAPGTLSLVSEDALEAQIATRMLAATIHRDHSALLTALDKRLGWVAGRIELNEQTNPIGPGHVAVGVHAAFRGIDIEPGVRLILFKLVERELAGTLGACYEECNRMLVQAGVLPHLHRQPQAPARRVPQRPPRHEVEDAPGEYGSGPAPGQAGYGEESSGRHPGEGYGHHEGRAEAGSTGGYGGYASGRPLEPSEQALFSTLSDMLRSWRDVNDGRGNAQSGGGSGQGRREASPDARPLTAPEMISVLSMLQPEVPIGLRLAIDDPSQPITQRLKTELLASSQRLGLDPEQACLSPADEDAIDLVGMLFDVLLDERELVGSGRNLLGRLVVPYIKVALLDRRMFLRKTHPARRLLNALAEACEGNEGDTPHDRALLSKAEETVERLLSDFNENVAIFKTLEEEFRSFLEQHRKRVELAEKRTAEAQRGQERLETARSRALAGLEERLGERKLRPVAQTTLRRYWVHHATVVELRHGEDSEQYASALRVVELVVSSLDAAASGAASLAVLLPNLESALAPVLASSGTTGQSAEELIRLLERELSGEDETSMEAAAGEVVTEMVGGLPDVAPEPAPIPVPARDEGAPDGLRLVSDRDKLDYDPDDADRIRALAIGTWVEFIGEDGTVQPAKLSWQSPISSRLLFVNRRGGRLCVASAEELAAMMRNNRLRIRAVNTAFERAMHQVLGKLKTGGGAADA
jgi:hypothetical protein